MLVQQKNKNTNKICLLEDIKFALPFGWWRSPVAHLHGVQGVAGSNPVHPTNEIGSETSQFLFVKNVSRAVAL